MHVPPEVAVPPLVSIVVTNYNYAAFLRSCLISIARQSYRNIECIVVDDASTDGSPDRIREVFAEIGEGVAFRFVRLEENGGQMNAFHEGFARSRGAFVMFVDADDCLFEDFVETHLRAHFSRECSAAMTCSDAAIVDGEGQVIAGLRRGRVAAIGERSRLSDDMPVECRLVPDWQRTWRFDDGLTIAEPDQPLRYVSPVANFQRVWIWTSTSAVMFRRGALELVMTDRTKGVRISADFYLFQFCHLLGGTVLVPGIHGVYRRHGANNFARDATISHRTISGAGKGYGEMWALIRAEVAANASAYRSLLGRPRFMALVSILHSPREFGAARRMLGDKDATSSLTLLAHMLLRQARILPRRLGRAFG